MMIHETKHETKSCVGFGFGFVSTIEGSLALALALFEEMEICSRLCSRKCNEALRFL